MTTENDTQGSDTMIVPEQFRKLPVVHGSCSVHGDYETVQPPVGQVVCPSCTRESIEQEHRAECRALLSQQQKADKARRIEATELPVTLCGAQWAGFKAVDTKNTEHMITARNYAMEWTGGEHLILAGAESRGKNLIGAMICKTVAVKHSGTVLYTTAERIGRSIRAGFNNDPEGRTVNDFVRPDLLLIDEIGLCELTEFERNTLDSVVSDRISKGRSLVLCTNTSMVRLAGFVNQRRLDDLLYSGQALSFTWPGIKGNNQD